MTIILSYTYITKKKYGKDRIHDVFDRLSPEFEWLESYNMPEYMVSWNVEISYGHVENLKLKAFALIIKSIIFVVVIISLTRIDD